eukprot:1843814-Rhodomonas_salina.5
MQGYSSEGILRPAAVLTWVLPFGTDEFHFRKFREKAKHFGNDKCGVGARIPRDADTTASVRGTKRKRFKTPYGVHDRCHNPGEPPSMVLMQGQSHTTQLYWLGICTAVPDTACLLYREHHNAFYDLIGCSTNCSASSLGDFQEGWPASRLCVQSDCHCQAGTVLDLCRCHGLPGGTGKTRTLQSGSTNVLA